MAGGGVGVSVGDGWEGLFLQEKDFFMERMKEELERLKNKQMRTEMRKLKVIPARLSGVGCRV